MSSAFTELMERLNNAALNALLLLSFHARQAIVTNLNQQKPSQHTLNQALAEGADEAFSSFSSNGGAQSAVMMHNAGSF
jgi:hypothetical protein